MKRDYLMSEGIDFDDAMRRLGNREDRYLKYLACFPEDDNMSIAQECFTNEKYSDAEIPVHTLKGVAGNLGVTPVYQAAQEVITHLRAGEYGDAKEKFVLLEEEYDRCCRVIEEMKAMED